MWLSLGQLKHDKEIQEMHLKKINKIKLKWESLKEKKERKYCMDQRSIIDYKSIITAFWLKVL